MNKVYEKNTLLKKNNNKMLHVIEGKKIGFKQEIMINVLIG